MGAAVECTVGLYTVAYDTALAMFARWCEHVDSAFKAIEYVCGSIPSNCDRLVVAVAADFALFHVCSPGSVDALKTGKDSAMLAY